MLQVSNVNCCTNSTGLPLKVEKTSFSLKHKFLFYLHLNGGQGLLLYALDYAVDILIELVFRREVFDNLCSLGLSGFLQYFVCFFNVKPFNFPRYMDV